MCVLHRAQSVQTGAGSCNLSYAKKKQSDLSSPLKSFEEDLGIKVETSD